MMVHGINLCFLTNRELVLLLLQHQLSLLAESWPSRAIEEKLATLDVYAPYSSNHVSDLYKNRWWGVGDPRNNLSTGDQ